MKEFETLIKKAFEKNRLEYNEIKVLGTPRRMALFVTDLSTSQPDRTVEVLGPPKKAAFDDSGNPTKASEGFAKKYGMSAADLKIKSTDRGEYVYLINLEKGKSTAEVLADVLPEIISSLNFPKSMHFSSFEDGKLTYARPIRWIVALLGDEVIKFSVGRVVSDKITYGHRFLSSGALEIKDASLDNYKNILKDAGIIADHAERRSLIKKQVSDILESKGCLPYMDEDLLNTIAFLVENPKPVVGSFNESYLSLPVEVLETAMKKHQKYFALHTEHSRKDHSPLLPNFITITNGAGDDDVIRHGNERVLVSRLADAEFFYNEDQKEPFADKLGKLRNVVFQEELGSLYDKSLRLGQLSGFLCNILLLDENTKQNAIRAAELCKVDLITQMVGEFPTLQGIIGGYYAANSGETDEVANAIRSHYYPTSPTGSIPEGIVGCVVSIADKLDTIVGYFAIGNIPSGSQDPYALRRQAIGIVKIVAENSLALVLDDVVQESVSLYKKTAKMEKIDPNLANNVIGFLKGRISSILSDRGFAYDVVDSIISAGSADPVSAIKRANAIADLRKQPDFDRIYPAFNRVLRILPDQNTHVDIDPGLFQDDAESLLYKAITNIEADVAESVKEADYNKMLDKIVSLCDSIDVFFDKVMVMVEDEKLRDNRLAILNRIAEMVYLIADFSKLVVQ